MEQKQPPEVDDLLSPFRDDAVGNVVTRRQFQHAVRVHGAQIPADICADAGQDNDRTEPQQSPPRADRVRDFWVVSGVIP